VRVGIFYTFWVPRLDASMNRIEMKATAFNIKQV
jgi:hypothetical protein